MHEEQEIEDYRKIEYLNLVVSGSANKHEAYRRLSKILITTTLDHGDEGGGSTDGATGTGPPDDDSAKDVTLTGGVSVESAGKDPGPEDAETATSVTDTTHTEINNDTKFHDVTYNDIIADSLSGGAGSEGISKDRGELHRIFNNFTDVYPSLSLEKLKEVQRLIHRHPYSSVRDDGNQGDRYIFMNSQLAAQEEFKDTVYAKVKLKARLQSMERVERRIVKEMKTLESEAKRRLLLQEEKERMRQSITIALETRLAHEREIKKKKVKEAEQAKQHKMQRQNNLQEMVRTTLISCECLYTIGDSNLCL